MIFDLLNPYDRDKYIDACKKYLNNNDVVEMKKKFKKRTLKQNSYLHLILSYFASEFGYTLVDVKHDIFKKTLNKDLFVEEFTNKYGKTITRTKHTNELDTKDMTTAIERFRNWSASEAGLYIPSPKEHDAIIYAEKQVESAMLYL